MELDYDGLKKSLSRISARRNGQLVPYRGRDYWIGISPQGPIAEIFAGSFYGAADIYIWNRVPPKFRKPVIFHEVLEADLSFYQGVPKQDAHNIASGMDSKYAEELLRKEDFEEYKKFKDQLTKPSESSD